MAEYFDDNFLIRIEALIRKEEDVLNTMFSRDFRRKFEFYGYFGQYLDDLSKTCNYDDLFVKSEPALKIFPRFRFLEKETFCEDQRGGSFHAIYNFNDQFTFGEPSRVEIVKNTKNISEGLGKALKNNGLSADKIVDIEFIERIPMHQETQSDLQDIIMGYYNDPRLGRKFLEDYTGDLKMMQEVEKLHLMFAVGDIVIPVYLGVGSNQPYKLSEKTKNGKNRYYRLDLLDENFLEQTSRIRVHDLQPKEVDYLIENADFSYGDPMPDGTIISTGLLMGKERKFVNGKSVVIDYGGNKFAEWERYLGSFQKRGYDIKKLELVQDQVKGKTVDKVREIVQRREFGTKLVEEHLLGLFPCFDRYSQVFYDPFRIISCLGMMKPILHLKKHDLLDEGYTNIQNLASDLYKNGFPGEKRMRGIALLAMNYIRHGKLDELIRNTARGEYTKQL